MCCGGLHCRLLIPAPHLETARTPFGFPDKITFAGVASVSRPFAPRPTRCAVCRSSIAKCYVCYRRPPFNRVWATFDVAHIAGRKICISVSLGRSLLASGGNPSNPACAPSPIAARNLHRLPSRPPLAGEPSALTLNTECALPKPPRPIRLRRWSRALATLPIAAALSPRGSRSLRSRSRRAGEFPSVGRRGWSRSSREGTAFGGMRVWGCLPAAPVLSASRRGNY